jgi:5'-nucleotidase / UDP-sugar diphosphatase
VKKGSGSIFLLCCAFLLIPALLQAQQVSLTILHTNDLHSHLMPFSYPSSAPRGSDFAAMKERANIGGIAGRTTLVKRLREELERQGTTVWLVDAGDFSNGTPFFTEYHGEADVAAMNAAGYTFGTIGNHEFNNSLAKLKSLIGMFHFPLLCANATEKSSGALLTRASEVRQVGGLKIGIFGLITEKAATYPAAKEGIAIDGEIKTSRRMVKALRPKADIIIAISHAGEKGDKQIATEVPGVDVIIGGHSHTRLPIGEIVEHTKKTQAEYVNGTIIVQAHQYGAELGRLDLLFDKDARGVWHIKSYHAALIPVTQDIPEDKSVEAVVKRFWEPIAARYSEIIGNAEADFVDRGDDLAPYNLVTDSIRETFQTDIELENMGSVRAPLIKGKITRGDLVTMSPFEDTVATFQISGRQLLKILKTQQPAVSGLRYRVENGAVVKASIAGEPVQEDRIYSGATNSFIARAWLKGIKTHDTGKLLVDVLINYIRKKGTVRPAYDGRRVVSRQ